jgi:hypothetical protein
MQISFNTTIYPYKSISCVLILVLNWIFFYLQLLRKQNFDKCELNTETLKKPITYT